MISIAIDDCFAANVVHVEVENFLREKVDQRLDALGHLLGIFLVFSVIKETVEVKMRISHLEAANVELVLEEH